MNSFGDAGLLEEIQHLGRIELARDHAAGAVIEAHHAPAAAADVEDRHRHQRDVVGRPPVPFGLLGLVAGLHQIEEVGVRQHRALRLACRAGGIELDRDILRRDRNLRIVGASGIPPRRKILPFRRAAFGGDDVPHVRQLRLQVTGLGNELRPDEQHRCLAIADDESDLGAGEAPVHRRHHHIGLHGAHQELEIDVAVLAEIGDALARLDAERDQRVGNAVGLDVEFGEGCLASFEFIDERVAATAGALAHHVGQVGRWLCGHVSPVTSCVRCAEFGVIRQQRQYGIVSSISEVVVPANAGTTRDTHPRAARSFSFCALIESRAVFQSASLQSRNS